MAKWGADVGRGLRRYWPFLAIAALQLTLLAAPARQGGTVGVHSSAGSAGVSNDQGETMSGPASAAGAPSPGQATSGGSPVSRIPGSPVSASSPAGVAK